MAEYKRQHFLSEFYLKGFSKSNPHPKSMAYQTWFYTIKDCKIEHKETKNVAKKSYMYSKVLRNGVYDHSLELFFSKLEDKVKRLIKKIDDNVDSILNEKEKSFFNESDKELLLYFLFWSMKKHPYMKEKIEKDFKDFYKEQILPYSKLNDKELVNTVQNISIELIKNLGDNEEKQILEILLNKNVFFCYLPNDKYSFITIDNPVVVFNQSNLDGIIYENSEIYFPLNHKVLLMLHETGSKIEYRKISNRKELFLLNVFIASKAKELIVARDKEYLMKIVKKLEYPLYNNT